MGCIKTESAPIQDALKSFADYIKGETLTVELTGEAVADAEPVEAKVDGENLNLYVKVN